MKNNSKPLVKFWSPLRLVSTVIVLGLLVAFVASSCNSNDPNTEAGTRKPIVSAPKTNPATGTLTAVPPNVLDAELRQANGSSIKLSDYSGKVVLVNLWATWCGPCRMETPELVKIHQEFQDRGLEMIALSTENPEASKDSVRAFIKEFNVNYHVGWATPEVSLTLMQGQTSIPQNFVITRDGRIKKRFIGYSAAMMPQMKKALEEALN